MTAADDTSAVPPQPRPALERIAERIAAVSPAWSAATCEPDDLPDLDGAPDGLGSDRLLGFETIREGWLLHHGRTRVVTGASPDLALLVGDWAYADGLCTVADHGSLDDVSVLADLVADVSARAAERPEDLEARWTEGAAALAR